MDDGLSVTITNYSDIAWGRNNWKVGAGRSDEKNWPDEITQVPAVEIEAHDGQTSAAVNSEHMTFIVKDALWMIVGYGSSAGDFAVQLQQNFHLFGIGAQNEWSHWDNNSKSWTGSTTDASPQTWSLGNYEVLATPQLSNSAASVSIIIRNKAKVANH